MATHLFDRNQLEELVGIQQKPCVSIYVPTARAGRETLQGAIHLKNLLKAVVQDLNAIGLRESQIEDILGAARLLVDDTAFWQDQNSGLALFYAPGMSRMYKLPISVSPKQTVGDTFEIVPLLPLLANDGRFYILAVSENEVTLLEATRDYFCTVDVEGLPKSMADALWTDDKEKQLQWHSGAGRSPSGSGRAAMYFGTGDGAGMEQHKADFKRYFQLVDSALEPVFKKDPAPVVLAGVGYLLPIYRSASKCTNLLEGEVHGNKDRTSASDLHVSAWAVAQPCFASSEKESKEKFHQLLAAGTASGDQKEILVAAESGRVETLFVSLNGNGNSSLNQAAVVTLLKGGIVRALPQTEMPSAEPMVASFRY